jgi:hypothetical protein
LWRRIDVFETDEHGVIVNAVSKLFGECLIDASSSGVCIDCCPYCFTALLKFGEAMPVITNSFRRRDHGVVQTDVVLTGTTMPHRHRSLAATAQIAPQVHLVMPWRPAVVRQHDVDHGEPANGAIKKT